MKTVKKLFLFSFIAAIAIFTACEKEEDQLSYEESKEVLNNLDTQMASDMEMMTESEGMTAVATLQGMNDPFTPQKSTGNTAVIESIQKLAHPAKNPQKLKSISGTEPFNFSQHTGTYTWNNPNGKWDYSSSPTDKIVIVYPADSTNMSTNNATLTIHSYTEQQIDTYNYQPTAVLADIFVNDTKVVEIDMSASYDEMGGPNSLNLSVFLKPFTFSGSMESTSTSADVDFAIAMNDEDIFSTGISSTFMTDSMVNPKEINGYIQYRKVKLDMTINAENLMTLMQELETGNANYTMEELEDAINKEIDAKILNDGNKLADVEVRYDEEIQDFKLVLVFNDGTVEDADTYFDNFATRMEEFFNMVGLQLENTFGSY